MLVASLLVGMGACLLAWLAVVATGRILRDHVANGGNLSCPAASRLVMVSSRRLLRCVLPRVIDRAATVRAAQQEPGESRRAVCLVGDGEFDLWYTMVADLKSADTVLPPVLDAVNCGVEGATSDDLRRNAYDLVYRHVPRVLVLHLGTSDYDAVWVEDGQVVARRCVSNLAAIIDGCYGFGTRDVRILLTPDPPGLTADQRRYRQAYVAEVTRLVLTYDPTVWHNLRLDVVDARATLGEELAGLAGEAYLADGLGLTTDGHRLKGEILRGALAM
jgi:hypothetical protein